MKQLLLKLLRSHKHQQFLVVQSLLMVVGPSLQKVFAGQHRLTPTVALTTKTDQGGGSTSFVSNITNLQPGTTYFYRAYATNSAGTSYGTEHSFLTDPVVGPTVTTVTASSITQTTAVSGGTIPSNGGGEITAKGVCWSTSPTPTVALTTKTDQGGGSASFSSNLTNLLPGTTYYYRAYATNSAGTSYGLELTFPTAAVSLATLTTATVTSIGTTTAVSGGNITDDGGGDITDRGVCWSINHNPTTAVCYCIRHRYNKFHQ